jgi:PKD repeat protein
MIFNDMSTGSPASWSWNFGDGTVSTEQYPVHFYMTPGSYTVTLTVANAGGSSQSSRSVSISNFAKTRISYYPAYPPVQTPVTFMGTLSGVLSWSWNFGDGQVSSAASPAHVYSSPGTYTVTLDTVNSDAANPATSLSNTITVVASYLGPTADSDLAKLFIDTHNQGRAGTLPGEVLSPTPNPAIPPLTWSQNAADIAQAYANQCIWNHNGGRTFDGIVERGENLWASTGTQTSNIYAYNAVKAWVNEWTSYTYGPFYQASAGHFTQVVWRSTMRVGCSRPTPCNGGFPPTGWTGAWTIIVCDYEPPGNYGGQAAW